MSETKKQSKIKKETTKKTSTTVKKKKTSTKTTAQKKSSQPKTSVKKEKKQTIRRLPYQKKFLLQLPLKQQSNKQKRKDFLAFIFQLGKNIFQLKDEQTEEKFFYFRFSIFSSF